MLKGVHTRKNLFFFVLASAALTLTGCARRQDLNVRTSDLPAAINAVPQNSWPYGRVVAVEEAHDAPASARPELRRNMEAAMKTLNDIGVVVYEWQEGGPALK